MRTSRLYAGAQRAFLLLLALTSTRCTDASYSYCKSQASTGEIECYVVTREHEPLGKELINFTRERELKQRFRAAFGVSLDGAQANNRYVYAANNVLRIKEVIDREALCDTDTRSDCSFKLSATAASLDPANKQFVSLSINVTVEDVNEPPKFRSPVDTISVDESLTLGSNITYRAQITNDDTFRLLLSDPTGTFVPQGSHNNLIVFSLAKRLDFETTRLYHLNLTACDTFSLCATLNLTVIVSDANDNDPDFGPSANQTVTIADNTERGTQIVQLTATDRDSGANGNVTYALENAKSNLPFEIDPLTGVVTTTDSLNIRLRERERSSYRLTVVATDAGSPQRSATATVLVSVIDANDHDPVITAGQSGMSVPEETAPFKVGFIIVSDADVGDNSRTGCATESAYRFNLTELKRWSPPDYSSKYELILTERIDFDSANSDVVHVSVVCHDFGSPQRTSTATFEVHLVPKNEYPPRFTQEAYRFAVVENQYPLIVGSVQATDMDRNTVLTYSMRPANGATDNATLDSFFEIDSSSGELRLRKPLDRETHTNFSFFVVADDAEPGRSYTSASASASHSASASVIIDVGNENDNAPICFENQFRVPENREAWHGVGRVGATDLDGDSLRFSLSLANDHDDYLARTFEINETGFIFTKAQLDRENRSEYRLKVAVGDGHFVTQCIVLILVTDVNDNAPLWPPNSDYQFNVSLALSSGSSIAELTAHDADNSSSLTYRFKSKYPDFIALDQAGKLYLVRDLTENDRREYLLTVEACDTDFRHVTAQDIRLLVMGDRMGDMATPVAAKEQPTLMWNLLISIIIIVTTITISCLLIVAILFLRKRIRKQALIAREREQLRRSLQAAAACKMKLTQAGSNALNPSMVSSAYGIQQLKRSPNDFIVHQSIEHDPDCALVEHLKWISNSQLLDPSSFYAKAPTPDYNTLNSKYSTFVKYASNANSPEAIYGDQVMSNQLSGLNLNNGVTSSHSASSTEAGGGGSCSGNAPVLNVRTNLNDSTSSRSNSNNTENHFCPPEVNFMPVPKIAPASSESKLSMANATCRVNVCSCDGNQVLLQPANNSLYGCTAHSGTLPKKRPHTAMNQPFYGTVFTGGAPQMACEMHTFLPQNRLQSDAVEVIDRGSVGRASHDMASFNNMDQLQLAVTKCDLPDWYRTHPNHHMSPSSPYAAHNHNRVQMHSPYGIYSEARVLPTGTIINTIQHQPMIPVKELEGDEV